MHIFLLINLLPKLGYNIENISLSALIDLFEIIMLINYNKKRENKSPLLKFIKTYIQNGIQKEPSHLYHQKKLYYLQHLFWY